MLRLAAQHLLPGEGRGIELRPIDLLREDGRGGVADGEAFAVGRDEIAVRHAHAGGRAVPGEHHVAVEIDLGKIGQLAVGRDQRAHVLELELLGDVGDPVPAERLPGEHIDAARAEQRPERHLHRAGIRGRHDRDQITVRKLEQLARAGDRQLEPRLGLRLAVIAAEQRALKRVRRPAGTLGARARREARIVGAKRGFLRRVHGEAGTCWRMTGQVPASGSKEKPPVEATGGRVWLASDVAPSWAIRWVRTEQISGRYRSRSPHTEHTGRRGCLMSLS